ncbi:hypothetical protein IEQ34_020107 [Dendrobium chrysotoxum]|uniref:Uncharacterized protein n=1 Tax=Dendrobium chrysotoxum TaxID=161865 RepID=A0AAV7FKE3_DENCH|nr:hypothetical protein IEQ34_020107 [Dendrobium chrysotoxum]
MKKLSNAFENGSHLLKFSIGFDIKIPHLRPVEYKRSRSARNRKTVHRAYGGVLSGGSVRERLEQKIVKKVLKIQKAKEKHVAKNLLGHSTYLVPQYLKVGQFVYMNRKRIKLSVENAIYIFVDNRFLSSSTKNLKFALAERYQCLLVFFLFFVTFSCSVISKIYEENKDEDGFLCHIQQSEYIWYPHFQPSLDRFL